MAMHKLVDQLVAQSLGFAINQHLSHAEIVGALELAKLTVFELTMERAREMKDAARADDSGHN